MQQSRVLVLNDVARGLLLVVPLQTVRLSALNPNFSHQPPGSVSSFPPSHVDAFGPRFVVLAGGAQVASSTEISPECLDQLYLYVVM